MEFRGYYGKHKRQKHLALPSDVIQKGKTLQLRIDNDLNNDIEGLAKELNQTVSKVAKDILRDFFLEREVKRLKYEISDI